VHAKSGSLPSYRLRLAALTDAQSAALSEQIKQHFLVKQKKTEEKFHTGVQPSNGEGKGHFCTASEVIHRGKTWPYLPSKAGLTNRI